MKMDNIWNYPVDPTNEILFRSVIEEYFSLVDSMGRVPATHSIHERVRFASRMLLSGSWSLYSNILAN